MNNFLRCPQNVHFYETINILIISEEAINTKLCNALQSCLEKRKQNGDKFYSKLHMIQCANVDQILRETNEIAIDFVVFLLDTRMKNCADNIDMNLLKLDSNLAVGRMCIINGTCHTPHVDQLSNLNSIMGQKVKYGCTLLNGNVLEPESCFELAERLCNLINVSLGTKGNLPFMPWLQTKLNS